VYRDGPQQVRCAKLGALKHADVWLQGMPSKVLGRNPVHSLPVLTASGEAIDGMTARNAQAWITRRSVTVQSIRLTRTGTTQAWLFQVRALRSISDS
jgi:hypothetical protein